MLSYTNEDKLSFEQLVCIEKKIYEEQSGCDTIKAEWCDIKKVLERKVEVFRDKEYNIPQNIFLIYEYKGYVIVGRKIPSVLFWENKINAINCSMITADMLLGVLDNKWQKGKDIGISYYPFKKSEKKDVFSTFIDNSKTEIIYPFLYKEYDTGMEEITSPDGWDISPQKATYLSYGEEHLRKYSINILAQYLNKKNVIVYDPACSTGEFLYSLKRAYPNIWTIGQDLSKSMVEYATPFVDEIYQGDSIYSVVKDGSVDVMIFRFLNSEVVSKEYAYRLFVSLSKKISQTGVAVLFGHTAVLLDSSDFLNNGFKVLQCSGYDKDRDCIFQYYIIKR